MKFYILSDRSDFSRVYAVQNTRAAVERDMHFLWKHKRIPAEVDITEANIPVNGDAIKRLIQSGPVNAAGVGGMKWWNYDLRITALPRGGGAN